MYPNYRSMLFYPTLTIETINIVTWTSRCYDCTEIRRKNDNSIPPGVLTVNPLQSAKLYQNNGSMWFYSILTIEAINIMTHELVVAVIAYWNQTKIDTGIPPGLYHRSPKLYPNNGSMWFYSIQTIKDITTWWHELIVVAVIVLHLATPKSCDVPPAGDTRLVDRWNLIESTSPTIIVTPLVNLTVIYHKQNCSGWVNCIYLWDMLHTIPNDHFVFDRIEYN